MAEDKSMITGISAIAQEIDEARRLSDQSTKSCREGRHKDVVSLAEKSLAIRENFLGPDHPDAATSLHNLGCSFPLLATSI